MGTVLFYAIVIIAIGVSRKVWPHWWKSKPLMPMPAAVPQLPEGLPPGTSGARRVSLDEAKPGDYVAVVGRIVEAAELTAPLSRRSCVASDLVVSDSRSGERVARVLRAGSFIIDDGRGRARVDARGAFVRVEHDQRIDGVERSRFDDGVIPPHSRALSYTADEGVIATGQYVLVIGMVERGGAGGDADYRSSAGARVQIGGGGVRPSVVSTVPADLHHYEL